MPDDFFEHCHSIGILRRGQPQEEAISRLRATEILDLAALSHNETSTAHTPTPSSFYSYAASIPLSGGRWPCSSIACRNERANETAQFAALYADRVYVHNPIAHYADRSARPRHGELQQQFLEDLSIYAVLRPLADADRIVFTSLPADVCPHCVAELYVGKEAIPRLDSALSALREDLSSSLAVSLSRESRKYVLSASGPERLLEHGETGWLRSTLPPPLKAQESVVARLKGRRSINLTNEEMRNSGVVELLLSEITQNVLHELATARGLKASYLTARSLDIELLTAITQDGCGAPTSGPAQRHLSCVIPFLKGVSPQALLDLRQREGDSFILFREALRKTIAEYGARAGTFSEADATAIYHDVLAPELSRLNNTVALAKRSHRRGLASQVLGWGAAITVGSTAGVLPASVAAIATALGLVKVVADLVQGLVSPGSAEESIRSDQLYFLWKVRQLSSKEGSAAKQRASSRIAPSDVG